MRSSNKLQTILVGTALIGIMAAGCTMDAQSSSEPTSTASSALTSGAAAFVWSNVITGSGNGVSDYNSSGGSILVTQVATGQYHVDFAGLAGSAGAGNVQVTANGSHGERCKVAGWGASGTALRATVYCFTATGAPLNSTFTASFVQRTDFPGAEGAYLWAYSPSSTSYTLSSSYQWNSANAAMSITHTPGSGDYTVSLGGQNLGGGTVQVTAYGSDNAYCKVGGWGGTVDVRCFNGSNGQPIDSAFTMIFDTKSPNNIPSYTYVWANQPTSASYQPSPSYEHGSLNTECGTSITEPNVTIGRISTGNYEIFFPGMASVTANPDYVKVTGYGAGSDTCEVVAFSATGANAQSFAQVQCTSANGTPVDAFYTITYSSFAYTLC